MLNRLLSFFVRILLCFRYKVELKGLSKIENDKNSGILFLPNHPALIDPVIMTSLLHTRFKVRPLADEEQVDRPFIRWIAKRLNIITIPDFGKKGNMKGGGIDSTIKQITDALKNGENILLYPAGHIYRDRFENLGGNSAVEAIFNDFPETRVVLVKTEGLWGSSFGYGPGETPDLGKSLKNGILGIFFSFIFFVPKRKVTITFTEPDDIPKEADKMDINRYLEAYYNENAPKNTYIPYSIWQGNKPEVRPEPQKKKLSGDLNSVPEATKKLVLEHLADACEKKKLSEKDELSKDLGLDSLTKMELTNWLEKEFGFPQGNPDSLVTVSDVMLAACGQAITTDEITLNPVNKNWFYNKSPEIPLTFFQKQDNFPEPENVIEAFLKQAEKNPKKIIVADNTTGTKTYQDLAMAIFALKPFLEKIPEKNIGILLPSSVAAVISYLACISARKVPVMINWTVGERNLAHIFKTSDIKTIISVQQMISRLEFSDKLFNDINLFYLQNVLQKLTLTDKISVWLKSRFFRASLKRTAIDETAVILFTSGSENLPKAVPLSHKNILTNVKDISQVINIQQKDRLIGILPPFHSFGISGALIMPICIGLPTVYHTDPTESSTIAEIINKYKISMLLGTPTFLGGIIRTASKHQLDSLTLAFVGAEKCPENLYKRTAKICKKMVLLEGYGITECSPVVSVNRPKNPQQGTIGQVLPSVEYIIVNPDTLKKVSRGTKGLLLVRGPSIFSGYMNYEGASPFVELDGKKWYKTGDLVIEDEQGILTFAGRIKRFIKLGGEMISLPAIEDVLTPHFSNDSPEGPMIAVEATSHETSPEIILFSMIDTDREEVNNIIRASGLSPLYNIRKIVKIAQIPLLGTGKTDYRTLKTLI
ncbi:MAG: AMP-binding protein [Verrucomicrobiota bacterium]|nr:AMP-binding protein [Verrucomicrobiota bacterium]